MTGSDDPQALRRHWLAVLARSPREALEQALVGQAPAPAPQTMRAAEVGMTLLRGRVGGTGDAFNLGEATVARCAVRVGAFLGVGYTLGRDRRHAELVALFDALLQDSQRQAQLLRDVVQPLAAQQATAREAQSRAAAASRVQFFTMVRGEAA